MVKREKENPVLEYDKLDCEVGKYGQVIVYRTPDPAIHAGVSPYITKLVNLNHEILKGSFYLGGCWRIQGEPDEEVLRPHWHDWDEYIIMLGSNWEDPFNLNGEVEMWFGDEKHIITRSCVIFIPRGVPHLPRFFRKVDRPMITLSTGPVAVHTKHLDMNPKWSHLRDNPPSIYTYPY